jgi:predicted helicase
LVGVAWTEIVPDRKNNWITEGLKNDFESLPALDGAIFAAQSNGLKTNRDAWAYNFNPSEVAGNIKRTIAFYSSELHRWRKRQNGDTTIDDFVRYNDEEIAWSRDLKADLLRERELEFTQRRIRLATYRPFTRCFVYFDSVLNEEVYGLPNILPRQECERRNRIIWWKVGSDWSPFALVVNTLPDVLPQGGSRCFPFYTYDEEGADRHENITEWALNDFRTHYGDASITKWDIFHYIYAVLHHPEYRTRYAANLKRELPRIPFVEATAGPSTSPSPAPQTTRGEEKAGEGFAQDDTAIFWRFVDAGRRLAELHVNYEKQAEYPLERVEEGRLNYRVEKMRLSKDKTTLAHNDFLTLKGIPPETYEYRLGNRSALEWVVDQYQVSTDKRSGIVNDPNREDDPEYIVRLIGQVITVSLETMKIVKSLPQWAVAENSAAEQVQ